MSTQRQSNSPPANGVAETSGSQAQVPKAVSVHSPLSDKSDSSQENGGGTKKPRTQFSPSQLLHLEESFSRNPLPNPKQREQMSRRLELTSKHIQVWFQNRRAKDRRRRKREQQEINLKLRPKPPSFWPQNLPFDSNFTAILNTKGKGTCGATSQQETSSRTNQELSSLAKPNANDSSEPPLLTTSASPPSIEIVKISKELNANNAGALRESSDCAQDVSAGTQSTPSISSSEGEPDIPLESHCAAIGKNLSRHRNTSSSRLSLPTSSTPFSVGGEQSNTNRESVISLSCAVGKDSSHSAPTCDDTASFSPLLSDTGSSPTLTLMEKSAGKANDAGSISWSGSQRPTSLPTIRHMNGSTASSVRDQDLMLTCVSDSVLGSTSSQLALRTQSSNAVQATTPDATESLHSLDSSSAGASNNLLELSIPESDDVCSQLNLEEHSPIFAEDPITLAEILGDEWAFLDSHLLPMTVHGNHHCPVGPSQTAFFPPLSTGDCSHLARSTVPFPQPEQGQLNSLYHRTSLPPSPSPPYQYPSPLYHDSTSWPFARLPVSLSYSTHPYHPAAIHSNFSSLSGFIPPPNAQRNCAINCVAHNGLPNHLPYHTRH